MNYSLAVFLINKTVRAVGVSYEPDPTRTDTAKAGSITIYKTIDQSLAVKDLVIVPTNTRWGFTVGRVEELDVDVNFDSQTQMDWIVDTADRAAFEKIRAMEAEAISTIRRAEIRRKREELARDIFADNPELKTLAISDSAVALDAPVKS